MTDPKDELTDQSDLLLAELTHLRATEQRKRLKAISTPPFHALADEVMASSRRVYRIAAEQDRLGEASETGDESIEDIEREG